jgi:hypothetical protein
MRCSLCNKEKPLIKKSHIIPDFFYRNSNLYNSNHTINTFTINTKLKNIKKSRPIPTGVYQSNILCKECDNAQIGQYESYLKSIFFGGPTAKDEMPVFKNLINKNSEEFTECTNLSYLKFKLGLLSILWRSAIAKRDFFDEIVLSDEDLESIRTMLITNDSGEIGKYPVVIFTYVNDSVIPKDLIVKPRSFSHNKGSGFIFLIGGFFFLFYINHSFTNEELSKYTITKDGKALFIWIKKGDAWDWILKYSGIDI